MSVSIEKRKRRRERYTVRDDVVPEAGLEPARRFRPGILSPVRLPIPPFRQRKEQCYCIG